MKKAGEVLRALFQDRFGPRFFEMAKSTAGLFSAWAEITAAAWPPSGEREKNDSTPAASHSRIREFEKGIMLVEADHPGMIQLLQIKQTALLEISRRRFPELAIRGISFCLSRDPFSFSAAAGTLPREEPETKPAGAPPEPAVIGLRDPPERAENDAYYAALKKLGDSVKKNEQQ